MHRVTLQSSQRIKKFPFFSPVHLSNGVADSLGLSITTCWMDLRGDTSLCLYNRYYQASFNRQVIRIIWIFHRNWIGRQHTPKFTGVDSFHLMNNTFLRRSFFPVFFCGKYKHNNRQKFLPKPQPQTWFI